MTKDDPKIQGSTTLQTLYCTWIFTATEKRLISLVMDSGFFLSGEFRGLTNTLYGLHRQLGHFSVGHHQQRLMSVEKNRQMIRFDKISTQKNEQRLTDFWLIRFNLHV